MLAIGIFAAWTCASAWPAEQLDTKSGVRTFTGDDGLPPSGVNAVVQTRDGYLWIGTFGGLARFDGLTFTVFKGQDALRLSDPEGGRYAGVGDLRGTVVDIDLRTSVVRDSDGAETLIPNSSLMEQNVKNVTFRTRINRQVLALVVDGASDPRTVGDAVRAAASRHSQLQESPESMVFLDEFAENGLRFVLHYWIEFKPGIDRRRIASGLRLMMLNAFGEAGIRLAPPPSPHAGH